HVDADGRRPLPHASGRHRATAQRWDQRKAASRGLPQSAGALKMLGFTVGEIIDRAKARLRRSSSDFCSPEEYRTLADVAWRRCYNRMARKFPSYYSADATLQITPGRLKSH